MNPDVLFTELTARGVAFEVRGDKLRFHPQDRVTAHEVDWIRRHKPAIVAMVGRTKPARSFGPVVDSPMSGTPIGPTGFAAYSDWCWTQISDDDLRYLTAPRTFATPCTWCKGRLVHSPQCDELRRSWEPKLPFGKHKGKPLSLVPRDYLAWLAKSDRVNAELRDAVQFQLHPRYADALNNKGTKTHER